MSLSVEISDFARSDLDLQYDWHFEHAGVAIAERYLEAFEATVKRLASNPGLGVSFRFREAELGGIRST